MYHLFGLLLVAAAPPARAATTPTYAHDIRPIFESRCVVCHSKSNVPDAGISGGLALDSYAAIRAGAAGRPILTPSGGGSSELLGRLTATSPSKLMPRGGPPLPAAQITLIRRWITAGAPAGGAAAAAPAAAHDPYAGPMPRDPDTLDVTLPTLIKPTVALPAKPAAGSPAATAARGNQPPHDDLLTFALRVGPLPPVTALAFSKDGKLLAAAGFRSVTIWDTATARPAACVTGLPGQVQALAFSPDGKRLAIGGGAPAKAGEVRVYDTSTWTQYGPALMGHTDVVYSVSWSPDGAHIATGSQDKTARIWDWPSGKTTHELKDSSDAITRVCYSPDGKALYAAGLDHSIRRYDVSTGIVVRTYTGHGDAVNAIAISPNGKILVSSGAEPDIRWWNADTGDGVGQHGSHSAAVNDLAFSKDSKFLVSASADDTARIWDGGNGDPRRRLDGAADWLYSAAISPDDRFVAAGGADGAVRLWQTDSGRLRLEMISWPSGVAGALPEWLAATPEGYYDGSAGWIAALRAQIAGKPLPTTRSAPILASLRQPAAIGKACAAAPLETGKVDMAPAAAVTAPGQPVRKPNEPK